MPSGSCGSKQSLITHLFYRLDLARDAALRMTAISVNLPLCRRGAKGRSWPTAVRGRRKNKGSFESGVDIRWMGSERLPRAGSGHSEPGFAFSETETFPEVRLRFLKVFLGALAKLRPASDVKRQGFRKFQKRNISSLK